MGDGSYAYTVVRLRMNQMLHSSTEMQKETDCHKDTLDGRATFNYRFIFPIKIPCRAAKVLITAVNVGQTGFFNDTIGEVTLDLGADYAEAKKTGAEVVMPR